MTWGGKGLGSHLLKKGVRRKGRVSHQLTWEEKKKNPRSRLGSVFLIIKWEDMGVTMYQTNKKKWRGRGGSGTGKW